jgi:hypothetical protein
VQIPPHMAQAASMCDAALRSAAWRVVRRFAPLHTPTGAPGHVAPAPAPPRPHLLGVLPQLVHVIRPLRVHPLQRLAALSQPHPGSFAAAACTAHTVIRRHRSQRTLAPAPLPDQGHHAVFETGSRWCMRVPDHNPPPRTAPARAA